MRPGVRCRYVVQNAALKSSTRRLGSMDVASGRRGVVPYNALGEERTGDSGIVPLVGKSPLGNKPSCFACMD